MAVPPATHWPTEVDRNAVIELVRSRPDLPIDQLVAEVCTKFPVLPEDRDTIKYAIILGISWGWRTRLVLSWRVRLSETLYRHY